MTFDELRTLRVEQGSVTDLGIETHNGKRIGITRSNFGLFKLSWVDGGKPVPEFNVQYQKKSDLYQAALDLVKKIEVEGRGKRSKAKVEEVEVKEEVEVVSKKPNPRPKKQKKT